MTRLLLLLIALVLTFNAIAGTCYVRKACLALITDQTACNYRV